MWALRFNGQDVLDALTFGKEPLNSVLDLFRFYCICAENENENVQQTFNNVTAQRQYH